MGPVSLPEEIRAACAWVAERARWVEVDEEAIEDYAAGLTRSEGGEEPPPFTADDPETPAEIDSALWNRGRDRRFKSVPRPRSRNTAY